MGWAKYHEDIVSLWTNNNHKSYKIHTQQKKVVERKEVKATLANHREREMSNLKEFTMSSARPLPVIVLADISGSMSSDGKIDALNTSISEMISAFADEDDSKAEVFVSIIAFGKGGAFVHESLQPAKNIHWKPLEASGRTPMGEAFNLTKTMVEDRELIPGRSYRPTIVLVSDGVPTDDWQSPLKALLDSERASKAIRFAMGIGSDADQETLRAFLADDNVPLFEAHEARKIRNFFRWVTMSVTFRSRSANPNTLIMPEPTDLDDFDF